jgi:hypothetical protein
MSDWFTLLVVVLALGGMAAANARAAASSAITLARSCWARIRSGAGGVSLDRWWLMTFAIGLLIGVVVGRGGLPVDWRAWLRWLPDVPVIVPVDHGPRNILIVAESDADTNTTLDSALVQLRKGSAADYLRSKSHKLLILDPEAVDASGAPSSALNPWREKFPGRQQPAIIISDERGKILDAEQLPASATSQTILEIVRAHE